MTRVFLVDDHEIVRRGLVDLLSSVPDFTVVGEAASVGEALARVPESGADVAVLDVRLPDGNGVELCRELRTRMPVCAPDAHLLRRRRGTLRRDHGGCSGFVLKQILGTDLVSAIRTVGEGGSLLDSRATAASWSGSGRRARPIRLPSCRNRNAPSSNSSVRA